MLDAVHGVGSDGGGTDRLLVALVADVHDGVPLAGPHLDLVVDLLHQRAHRVHDRAAPGPGRVHHGWWGAGGGARQRGPGRDLVDVVDEDYAEFPEAFHHHPVV